jgi:hypothetical protein
MQLPKLFGYYSTEMSGLGEGLGVKKNPLCNVYGDYLFIFYGAVTG